jgi:hypothetical protein
MASPVGRTRSSAPSAALGSPLKWQKYLLLLRFDLLDPSELQENIRRYRGMDQTAFLQALQHECVLAAAGDKTFLYVIKLVKSDSVGQLPNYRVRITPGTTEAGVERAIEAVQGFLASGSRAPDEIWWCRTDVTKRSASVAGRLLCQVGGVRVEQVIEHVSRASPRLIETVRIDRPEVFYLRARRPAWGFRWREDEIASPHGTDQEMEVTQFRSTARKIEALRGRLERLAAEIESTGLTSYSFEYKQVGSKLTIIDWDTADDRVVLARLS